MAWVHTINARVANSAVGRWFRLEGSGHRKARNGSFFLTELRAGLATFFAMAYIIAVNASIVRPLLPDCVLLLWEVLTHGRLPTRAARACATAAPTTRFATLTRSICYA